jgi:hypothetical protein
LKAKGLGVFRAKNKLVFEYKNPQTKRRMGLKMPNFEAGKKETGNTDLGQCPFFPEVLA